MYPQQPEQPPAYPDAQGRTHHLPTQHSGPSYPPTSNGPHYPPAQRNGPAYPPTLHDGQQGHPPGPYAQSYPPPEAYPPQPYYGPPEQYYPPYPPPYAAGRQKQTEFGWASIVVGGIALMTSWIPYVGWFVMGAVAVLVSVGMFGRYERTRIPAIIGAVLLGLSVLLHFLIWGWVQGWLPALGR